MSYVFQIMDDDGAAPMRIVCQSTNLLSIKAVRFCVGCATLGSHRVGLDYMHLVTPRRFLSERSIYRLAVLGKVEPNDDSANRIDKCSKSQNCFTLR